MPRPETEEKESMRAQPARLAQRLEQRNSDLCVHRFEPRSRPISLLSPTDDTGHRAALAPYVRLFLPMAVSGRGWLVHNTFMTLQITFCCPPRGKMLQPVLTPEA